MTTLTRLAAILALALHALAVPAAEFAPAQLRDFPRDALSIRHGGTTEDFHIWLADTPERQQQGLMFLTELPPGYGMLFPLPAPRVMTMWMKNTYIPLDMVFIGADGRILRIAHETTPLSTDIISSGVAISAVLEIRGGESRRLGLKEGDRVVYAGLASAKSR
jgi:uncharacterized membrane protein (UPF0127 family)